MGQTRRVSLYIRPDALGAFGVLVLGLIAVTYPSSRPAAYYLLGRVGLSAFLLLSMIIIMSFVCCVICAWRLSVNLQRAHSISLSLIAGENWTETSFRLPGWSHFIPLRFSLNWESPDSGQMFTRVEMKNGVELCIGETRGHLTSFRRALSLSDAWGLVTCVLYGPALSADIRIEPHRLKLAPPLFILESCGGMDSASEGRREGDLTDFRRYQIGDPLQRVLWKLSERNGGELLVRQHELAMSAKIGVFLQNSELDSSAASLLAYHASQLTSQNELYMMTSYGDVFTHCLTENDVLNELILHPSAEFTEESSLHALKDFVNLCIQHHINRLYIISGCGLSLDKSFLSEYPQVTAHFLNAEFVFDAESNPTSVVLEEL